jgi:membrane protease YdiL (CAAX protease family)
METRIRGRAAARDGPLRDALGLLVAVWSALALGGAIAPAAGREPALLGSFGLAAALCVVDRRARAPGLGRPTRQRTPRDRGRTGERAPSRRRARARSLGNLLASRLARGTRSAVFALLGSAIAPILGALIAAIGGAIGLAPHGGPTSPPSAIRVLCILALAPCFEEHVYRARLLPALAIRIGPLGAVLLSSLAFALPHRTPWSMLASAITGLVLGTWMQRSGRASDCVALHAGINFVGLVHDGAFVALGLSATAAFAHAGSGFVSPRDH